MSARLKTRLDRIDQVLGNAAVSPEKVREALHRLFEFGEVPEDPRLREIVVGIRDAVAEMDRRTCGLGDHCG